MLEFLLHFFPLLTFGLFIFAGYSVIRYFNAVSRIEKYMAANRPEEWEEMGKPSIFSGKYSENDIRFREMLEAGDVEGVKDAQLAILVDRSRYLKSLLARVTWAAFGMYFFTIIAVRYLLNAIAGA